MLRSTTRLEIAAKIDVFLYRGGADPLCPALNWHFRANSGHSGLESTREVLGKLASVVDAQAQRNPARIAKLRFILERMKACGLYVSKTAL